MTTLHQIYQHDKVLTFLTQGDFARGQRAIPVKATWIGSFATGQRADHWSLHA